MINKEIRAGDVVSLVSGSPRMSAIHIADDGVVTVGYFPYVKDESGPYTEIKIPKVALQEAPSR